MTEFPVPRTVEAATATAQRYAELDGEIAQIEARRTEIIAAANAECDAEAAPLLTRRDAAGTALSTWWSKAGHKLCQGKRKSIELGGCELGARKAKLSLAIDGDEDALVKTLQKRSWAAELLRTVVSLDKAAVLKALDGQYRKQLAGLGLGGKGGDDVFWIKRTAQGGVVSSGGGD